MTKQGTLPPVRTDLRDFEKQAAMSVDVLVRLEGFRDKAIGRYIHGAEEWQINGCTGYFKVLEWWPMPEDGTGAQA